MVELVLIIFCKGDKEFFGYNIFPINSENNIKNISYIVDDLLLNKSSKYLPDDEGTDSQTKITIGNYEVIFELSNVCFHSKITLNPNLDLLRALYKIWTDIKGI